MVILGLDPGIARTGFGVINTDNPQLFVRCGCITTDQKLSTAERLHELANDITQLIITSQPDHAVIERVFFNTNQTTAMRTAEARGVILHLLAQHRIPIEEITPLQIKSRLTGYGHATKKQIQAVVTQYLKLDTVPQPDDAADALAAALCTNQSSIIKSVANAQ